MDTLFAQLKKLHDNELYDQVQPIVSKFNNIVITKKKVPGTTSNAMNNQVFEVVPGIISIDFNLPDDICTYLGGGN